MIICIVENWIQFPVVTLNSSDLIYIFLLTHWWTHSQTHEQTEKEKNIVAVYCNYYDFAEQSLI